MIKFIGFYDYTVILTYISLCSAVLGMIQAAEGRYDFAVICLVISGVCDGFDGAVARTKKNRTEDEKSFGIQIDSLCDVICFGVFPAFLCYKIIGNSIIGTIIVLFYCLCAVIRLAFFNVLETKRQQTEGGCNKTYRGLPVTSISIILPIAYLLKGLFGAVIFKHVLKVVLLVTAFLFILDFSMKKINFTRLIIKD